MKSEWEKQGIPNPGTKKAQDMGCTCPVMDNHGGHGFIVDGEIRFWINCECPIHGKQETERVLNAKK